MRRVILIGLAVLVLVVGALPVLAAEAPAAKSHDKSTQVSTGTGVSADQGAAAQYTYKKVCKKKKKKHHGKKHKKKAKKKCRIIILP